MSQSTKKNLLVFVCLTVIGKTIAFPDGAPIDACVKPNKINQPHHGRITPQPVQSSPYQITATSDSYGPGTQITVTVQGRDTFKGFLIQARDAATNEWIGSWLPGPDFKIHPECSAVTHADPRDKQQAIFVWQAPNHIPQGTVYFTGTVLKEYSTFWSNLVSSVQFF